MSISISQPSYLRGGAGLFPTGIAATPTQQLSVADELANIGIPLGDDSATHVQPAALLGQSGQGSGGGSSSGSSGPSVASQVGSTVLGAAGSAVGSELGPVGTAVGGAIGKFVGGLF